MSFVDFSSMPRDQEQTFVVYEQRTTESARMAITGGVIAALVGLVVVIGIYFGVAPDTRDPAKGMNMSNLTKKRAAPAPAADQAPAATPEKAPTTAPGSAAAPAAEAPAPEAPAPATK